jgi:membrane protease YdiL (CAAX protease family)
MRKGKTAILPSRRAVGARAFAGLHVTSFQELAARGRTEWWRYLLAPLLGLVIATALGAAVFAVIEGAHLSPPDLRLDLQNPSQPAIFFASMGIVSALIVAGLALAMRLVQRKRARDVAGAWSGRFFVAGLALWTAAQLLALGLDYLVSPKSLHLTAGAATLGLAAWALPALALQSFMEEFLFRGYATQGFLLLARRPVAAAALSAILFGAMHIPNGAPQAANALIFGFGCALIAIRTASLSFTFGLHLANNVFGAVVAVSQGDVFAGAPGILRQDASGSNWLDVGVTAAALAAVVWIAARMTRIDGAAKP